MTQRREKLISHALSRILRHEALDHDLPMNSAGYVPILDVVTVQSLWNHQVSPAEVHHAAQINKKQRFEIQTVNGVACIRAVQGHDQRLAAFYNLSDSEMLQLLELPHAPRYAIHGTMLKHHDAIKDSGLCRRQRRHRHFIEDTDAAEARTQDREASGLRAGSEIIGWILPSYILWVQVTSTGQFVEAAEGQHLPTTRAVRDAIRISGQRTPRREREKNPAYRRSICHGPRSAPHEPRSCHVNKHVTDICTPVSAQVNNEHTSWHEAEIYWLRTAPHVSSPALSLQLNMRTECTAATGGGSPHLGFRKFMPAQHSPLPQKDHHHNMVSEPQPSFTHYTFVVKLHVNLMHTRYSKPHNFNFSWQLTTPSPSSQSRSARRLPSRLRENQAQPTGQLLELREAAAAKARAREQQGAARAQQATSREEEPWWSSHYDPGSWSWSMWTPHSTDWQWQRDQSTAPAPVTTSAPEGPNIAQGAEHEMGPALSSQDPHVQAARRILAAMEPGEAQTVLKFLSALPHPSSVLTPGPQSTNSVDQATQTETVRQSTAQVQTEGSEPQLEVRSPPLDRPPTEEPIGLPLCSLHSAQATDTPIDAGEIIEWSATSLILLPTIKNRLNTMLPELFRLLASLQELRAGDHITAAGKPSIILRYILSFIKLLNWRLVTGFWPWRESS